jgi:hypothetical protein
MTRLRSELIPESHGGVFRLGKISGCPLLAFKFIIYSIAAAQFFCLFTSSAACAQDAGADVGISNIQNPPVVIVGAIANKSSNELFIAIHYYVNNVKEHIVPNVSVRSKKEEDGISLSNKSDVFVTESMIPGKAMSVTKELRFDLLSCAVVDEKSVHWVNVVIEITIDGKVYRTEKKEKIVFESFE